MDDLDMPSMLKLVVVNKTEKKTEMRGPDQMNIYLILLTLVSVEYGFTNSISSQNR